jgi:Raf kinase inhibitor-like YbhB/YbcL family protein
VIFFLWSADEARNRNQNFHVFCSEALQTRTDFGAPGYGGPWPPLGDHPHRYLFTVFAVGVDSLPVTADTSAAIIGFQLNFNTLAKAAIMGLYKR